MFGGQHIITRQLNKGVFGGASGAVRGTQFFFSKRHTSPPIRANFGDHKTRLYSSVTPTPPTNKTNSTVATAASDTVKKLSKFKQYAEQFKNKPASHLIAFGLLHEVTAVVPLPIVYFALAQSGMTIPFPEQAMEEGNKFVTRVAKYYGWNLEGDTGARTMLNMATSYALVKAVMPLRLALCAWMTPWTATRVISPVMSIWRRFRK
ncbi:hypothetical protein BX616_004660 [Lobosporangium transversale]|uniref:Uncharacterized protein n=1 Tax=Lobosporangium transversale TaxID=64571 RepID=A0A1Y2GSA1_9FUNG|nr:hypothetical protein BCR41DRAFT_385519 [Lobosporangium transversale]KAF9916091.1 hypothetical protein BX616_004660 [Lobosporangium transversale]ORZ21027.1 hypothetical protein BCR41DRAFT_385519 [Lobosporangium transversale]|eukprot:XP_021882936.1 hypothetical protein BCR41DRAFT_385519 [Lobosporangium transversale]